MAEIRTKFQFVKGKIEETLAKSGRQHGSVKLVVVTKGQTVEKMQELIDSGGRYLGENYPEETAEKINQLTNIEQVEWHMIGNIQSRKIKYLTEYFDFIESVGSIDTAKKLDMRFREVERKIKILLEVNVSGEETKQGFALADRQNWEAFVGIVDEIDQLSALQLVGLMTMPPLGLQAENSRKYFKIMRDLLEYVNGHKKGEPLSEMSMGTSFDYIVAVEEGATIVRVGEAIMGARIYS